MDFHIWRWGSPSTETGKRTGFRSHAWSAALSGMWKMRSKSRISLTSTCWCVLRKKKTKERNGWSLQRFIIKSWKIFRDLNSHILFRKAWNVEIPPWLSCGPHSVCCGPLFSTSCFPPKQRLKRCVSRCSKRTMTFLQDQGNSKSTWVRQSNVSIKNHPIRASGIHLFHREMLSWLQGHRNPWYGP